MKPFMDENFLLQTDTAKKIFSHCKDQPIFDYHCHLSAREIYENRQPEDLAELWLKGDHYKWRVMRAHGVPEEQVTGSASGCEKFSAYAETLMNLPGNPLYHWSHLELQRYFGIYESLTDESCRRIWEEANARIQNEDFSPRSLIGRSNVYGLCTTESPDADLSWHRKLKDEGYPVLVLPAFRPDPELELFRPTWRLSVEALGRSAGVKIDCFAALKEALSRQMDRFALHGCIASDHGFEKFPWRRASAEAVEAIVQKGLAGESLTRPEIESYQTELLLWLGRQYAARGWAMEIHINCLRSRNTRGVKAIGEASGFDTVADYPVAEDLTAFLDCLEQEGALPKTVLFSLNPRDNMAISAMAGNYPEAGVPGKIQMGTAWWFQDHRDGMEAQMRSLADEGVLGDFIGMLTDSRSFLSYPRHEYFRRIFCNLLGQWVENGEFPDDDRMLFRLADNVCFLNAKHYFGV